MRTAIEKAREIVSHPDFDVPLPGQGATLSRFAQLAQHTYRDIAVGRMIEAHLDAAAILNELGGPPVGPDELWGVWAAEPPSPVVTAGRDDAGAWTLAGTKEWCSGASGCTHALVTARHGDSRPIFAVDLRQESVRPSSGGWRNVGMAGTDTETVEFEAASATLVGEAGAYLERAGFWHGGVGVAACWFGGAAKVAQTLYSTARKNSAACENSAARHGSDDVLLMHLGAVDALLTGGWAQLAQAAAAIDAAPDDVAAARHRAFATRWSIEQIATEVLDRCARALGPGPLVRNPEHAQAVADLSLYIRQSHADRDLVSLGTLALDAQSTSATDSPAVLADVLGRRP